MKYKQWNRTHCDSEARAALERAGIPPLAALALCARGHVVEKCTFCYHRTSQGIEPACMHLCVGRARFWGDLDDPNSEVSQLIATRSHKRLLEERGTEPSTYYLV